MVCNPCLFDVEVDETSFDKKFVPMDEVEVPERNMKWEQVGTQIVDCSWKFIKSRCEGVERPTGREDLQPVREATYRDQVLTHGVSGNHRTPSTCHNDMDLWYAPLKLIYLMIDITIDIFVLSTIIIVVFVGVVISVTIIVISFASMSPINRCDGRQHNGWTEWKEKDWKDRRQADRWRDWKDWAEKEEEQNRSQENWRSWKEWADREQEEHNEQKQREETKDAQVGLGTLRIRRYNRKAMKQRRGRRATVPSQVPQEEEAKEAELEQQRQKVKEEQAVHEDPAKVKEEEDESKLEEKQEKREDVEEAFEAEEKKAEPVSAKEDMDADDWGDWTEAKSSLVIRIPNNLFQANFAFQGVEDIWLSRPLEEQFKPLREESESPRRPRWSHPPDLWLARVRNIPETYGETMVRELLNGYGLPKDQSMKLTRPTPADIPKTTSIILRFDQEQASRDAADALQGRAVSDGYDQIFHLEVELRASHTRHVKVYVSDIPIEWNDQDLYRLHDENGLDSSTIAPWRKRGIGSLVFSAQALCNGITLKDPKGVQEEPDQASRVIANGVNFFEGAVEGRNKESEEAAPLLCFVRYRADEAVQRLNMVTVDSASEQLREKAEREKAWNREDRQADGGKDSATREAHGLPEGYARQRGFQLSLGPQMD
ncbi:hypothetical protein AK812_SmicGene18733 [Symbiodinium microadriaticum]|uniref:Uncharacterized protein n=1 Tax=Symbiodinium microadriaticum TaxID=2951 RepID=A0A1Q9DUE1_SYMMI|nr:hypothetical protein AK812_SmicGene18733 [Symbiodinium microadriaticum]